MPPKSSSDSNGWFVNNSSAITNCFENMGGEDSFVGLDTRQKRGGGGRDASGDEVLSPFSYRGSAGSTMDTPKLRPPSSAPPYPPAWLTAPIPVGSSAAAAGTAGGIGRSMSHDSARRDTGPLHFGSMTLHNGTSIL